MRKFVLAAVLVLMAGGAQAVTLDVVGGQLLGASDVLVDGSLYNVEFLDGTCIDLYNGCDDVSDFTFQTEASALLASQALLDQVFLNGPSGEFDSDPTLTNGCEPNSWPGDWCFISTPFGFYNSGSVQRADAVNDYPGAEDIAAVSGVSDWADFSGSPANVFSVWTPVPEPSTALLLGLGLAGMAARRRV